MEMHIANLERHTEDGFVTVAHWTATKTDGEFTGSSYGTVGFTKQDGMNLIPFESLTEAQVIGWVKEAMGQEQVEALEANLDKQIEAQKNPTSASGTPWGDAPAEAVEE